MLDASRNADLELALQLADLADHISVDRFGALDLQVDTKPDLTPVSDADRAVEQAIRAMLAHERPDDVVVGEEFGASSTSTNETSAPTNETSATHGRRWVIDPIDATKNFVRSVPVWATLIALMDDDEVVVGVVSAPALAHRWWAARGHGSWVSRAGGQPRRNAVSKVGELTDASVSYSSFSGWHDRRAGFDAILTQAWRTRAYGDFWSHMLVAEGAVDISFEPEVSIWDVAALVVIVEEAGGRFSSLDAEHRADAGSIVCTNGLLHENVLRQFAR